MTQINTTYAGKYSNEGGGGETDEDDPIENGMGERAVVTLAGRGDEAPDELKNKNSEERLCWKSSRDDPAFEQ